MSENFLRSDERWVEHRRDCDDPASVFQKNKGTWTTPVRKPKRKSLNQLQDDDWVTKTRQQHRVYYHKRKAKEAASAIAIEQQIAMAQKAGDSVVLRALEKQDASKKDQVV